MMTEGSRLISYQGGALFNRTCPVCGRFVKPDETILVNGLEQLHPTEPNATCKQHGRVRMPFEGYY